MVTRSSTPGEGALLAVKRDIESMKTRGAGEIGRQAALALANAADTYRGDSVAGLREFLIEAARLLSSARPTAVTLRNGLNAILSSVDGARGVEESRAQVRRAADEYANRVAAAKEEIARLALPLFAKNDVVLTHCHSTAAGGAIGYAAKRLAGVRVFSTETRPFRQGLIQAPTLAKAGVDVTLIVDSAVSFIMESEGVTKVVVGADTIDAEGGLYNKIGTRQVALLARHYKIPFYVCAEREKFSPYSARGEPVTIEERAVTEVADPVQLPGVRIRNPVFDRTAPGLITSIVTDRGIIRPDEAGDFIQREFAHVKQWI